MFLCPRCAFRESGSERNVRHQPRGCSRCGFGFAFELLEDYYASPKTALIVCDRDRRILVAGHSAFAVTGYDEGELLGHEFAERLGLSRLPRRRSRRAQPRVGRAGARRPVHLPASNGSSDDVPAVADFFPAYDDDGGLLVADDADGLRDVVGTPGPGARPGERTWSGDGWAGPTSSCR